MPPAEVDSTIPQFFGADAAQLDQRVVEWGWPPFRGRQVRNWVYDKLVVNPEKMSNLSQADRLTLAARVSFASAVVSNRQQSNDGTLKLVLTWPDGANAETVMIPDADRRTACISSQVGCPVGCKFCASGIGGVKGNLTAARIVEQVYELNVQLQPLGERITNIVFMGMGEPMANYANVMQAVRVLHDPELFQHWRETDHDFHGRRSATDARSGPRGSADQSRDFAPRSDRISAQAIDPLGGAFAPEDILDAARYYFDETGREITLEYILLSGVNDRPEHARQLAKLCKTLRANVNLIRYNEVEGLPFGRPLAADVVKFQEVLRENNINAHVRKSRGRDIDAACGQLRRKTIPIPVIA